MNVENIQTPAYVFDVDRLIYRIRKIKGFFGKNVCVIYELCPAREGRRAGARIKSNLRSKFKKTGGV